MKFTYKIGPELDGHILNGEKLLAGSEIVSERPLSGAGFSLVESESATISKPVPVVFDEPSVSGHKSKKTEKVGE